MVAGPAFSLGSLPPGLMVLTREGGRQAVSLEVPLRAPPGWSEEGGPVQSWAVRASWR
jgi:hypothetical protein